MNPRTYRQRMSQTVKHAQPMTTSLTRHRGGDDSEALGDRRRHPISCWYVCPLAQRAAGHLAGTRIRPTHVTLVGLLLALAGAAIVVALPLAPQLAAAFIWLGWLCDRIDGKLARRQDTASPFGAWLDACIDEFVDVALAVALAAALAAKTASAWPWMLLSAFLGGKFLLFSSIRHSPRFAAEPVSDSTHDLPPRHWLRRAYHLPGNADVRLHVLLACLVANRLDVALGLSAVYFPLRWLGHTAKVMWQCVSTAGTAAPPAKRGAA